MSYVKSTGTAAKGNDRLLKQYGGNSGSSPMARQHYATGGAVKGANPSLAEGLSASGAPAKRSLSRPGRKMAGKGKGKEAKTNINIIVAGGGKPAGPPPDMPMPPMPMAGPPPGPPPGGPPMPMRAHGGKVETAKDEAAERKAGMHAGSFAKGGKVKRAEGGPVMGLKNKDGGAGGAKARLAKVKMYGK